MKTLQPADVARQLNTSERAVRRLIALGSLKRNHAGISQAQVDTYLAAGAPQLEPPEFQRDGWYDNRELGQAAEFQFHLTEAAEDQKLSQEQAERLAATCEFDATIRIPILMTDRVRQVVEKPVPGVPALPANAAGQLPKSHTRFPTFAHAYLARCLRAEARRIVNQSPQLFRSAIEQLFESPQQFAEITKASVGHVMGGEIYFRDERKVSGNRVVNFKHSLAHDQLICGSQLEGLLRLTF